MQPDIYCLIELRKAHNQAAVAPVIQVAPHCHLHYGFQ